MNSARAARAAPGRALGALLFGVLLTPSLALAVDTPGPLQALPAQLHLLHGRLDASLDLSSAFGAAREQEFGNGLTNVVEIYTTVLPQGGGPPASIHGRIVEILFDVWEETYSVTVKDPEHPAGRRLILPTFLALRTFLGQQHDVDLGLLADVPESFRLEVRVEVNPISKEQLQRTREYIAAGARQSGSRSVLGAVASFLLREPNASSDVRLFRSPPFDRTSLLPR